MVGRRVIPRLWYARWAAGTIQFAIVVGSLAVFFAFLYFIPAFRPENRTFGIVGAIGPFLVLLAANYLGFRSGKHTVQRLGWMTKDEASELQIRMERWPESWLEEKPEPPPKLCG